MKDTQVELRCRRAVAWLSRAGFAVLAGKIYPALESQTTKVALTN